MQSEMCFQTKIKIDEMNIKTGTYKGSDNLSNDKNKIKMELYEIRLKYCRRKRFILVRPP